MFTSARGLPWQKVDVILWPSPYPTPASRTLTFPPEIEGSKSYVARAIFLKLFVADEIHLEFTVRSSTGATRTQEETAIRHY